MMKDVRVRMYRQGLGDCFLITFPGRERASHVLIDFGVLLGTRDAERKMRKIARQIVEATQGRLDALVVTHEHWDHVSGFAQAGDALGRDKLDVGQVWLSWSENPDDPLAMEMDKRKTRALKSAAAAAERLAGVASPGAQSVAGRLSNLLEFWGGLSAAGRRTTRGALDWVRNRTDPEPPKWLEPGMGPFPVPGAEDVRVFVLGPPRDPRFLKKSDPSKRASEVYELGAETDFGFLAAVEALSDGSAPEGRPFEDWFRVEDSEAKEREFFLERYGFDGADPRRIEHDWLGLAGRLALQLDSDTNNTSLVLAFELGRSGRVLLFPGDAQVGSWLSWHEGLEWKLEENGRTRTVTATDLLARTVLYKVGHHGSHNATLREKGLELMTSNELAAMLPVHRGAAEKMDWVMPFPALFERLRERCKGRVIDLEMGLSRDRPDNVRENEWERFLSPTRTAVTDDWIDLFIEM